ncbi:hypothetical protein SESBI_44158 [Sesbania bispinosa]|nr:hypothetical protein SESBI_44158 [Sesbania bispinosa]
MGGDKSFVQEVIQRGPWFVMGNIVSLQSWLPHASVYELDFTKISFWIQIHGLPLDMLNTTMLPRSLTVLVKFWKLRNLKWGGGRLLRTFIRPNTMQDWAFHQLNQSCPLQRNIISGGTKGPRRSKEESRHHKSGRGRGSNSGTQPDRGSGAGCVEPDFHVPQPTKETIVTTVSECCSGVRTPDFIQYHQLRVHSQSTNEKKWFGSTLGSKAFGPSTEAPPSGPSEAPITQVNLKEGKLRPDSSSKDQQEEESELISGWNNSLSLKRRVMYSVEKALHLDIALSNPNLIQAFVEDRVETLTWEAADSPGIVNPRNGFVTREKLDRILVTWEWRTLFPDALAISVPATSSDHTPIILGPTEVQGGKYFRFKAFWEEQEYDSILFAKADPKEALQLTKVLNSFSKASGQRVISAKSGVIFCGGVPQEVRVKITSLLNIQEWANPGRYLGLLAEWGRSRINSLAWLKDRVLQKLDGWRESLLNQAGKEVLIKVVLQAIPSYAMSVIKFPRKICEQIGSQVAKFWWRPAGKSRGIHWKSWKFMTNHKKARPQSQQSKKAFWTDSWRISVASPTKQTSGINNIAVCELMVLSGIADECKLMKATSEGVVRWPWYLGIISMQRGHLPHANACLP